jgi:hypothetical protein
LRMDVRLFPIRKEVTEERRQSRIRREDRASPGRYRSNREAKK